MSDQKINISPTGDKLLILQGDNPDPIQEVSVALAGNLSATSDWLSKKVYDGQECIIIIDPEVPAIQLEVAYRHSNKVVVSGRSKQNVHIDLYGINADKKFDIRTLLKQVRLTRYLFANDADFEAVKARLAKFTVKSKNDVQFNQQAGTNGSTSAIDKTVEWDELYFIMKCSLFSGTDPVTFRVNVCCEITDGGPKIYFESDELPTLMQEAKEKVVADEKVKLATYPISIITK